MSVLKDQKVVKKVPKLRFSGFSGEWEEKRLEEVAKINPKNSQLPEKFIYIDLDSVEKGVLKKKKIILRGNAPSRAQRILRNGDILFQVVRPYQRNNLYFNYGDDYVASTGYAQIRTENSSEFLFYYLHCDKFVNDVLLRCTGTSYPAINSNDLEKTTACIPTILEQQKIAEFLSSADDWINSLKAQKEKLEAYKKGMIQKIFSQEIRFKDDNGDDFPEWEEKRLGEICDYKNGGAFEKCIAKNGQYNLITLNSIDINGKLKTFHKTVNEADWYLKKNDLIMVLSDVAHGNFLGLVDIISEDHKYVLNQRMGLLRKKNDQMNLNFLRRYINHNQRYFKLHGQGSSQQNLSKGDILKFKVNAPSLPEQQKIADFLSSLDKLIEAKQCQIIQTQNWKKGLMQQLFV